MIPKNILTSLIFLISLFGYTQDSELETFKGNIISVKEVRCQNPEEIEEYILEDSSEISLVDDSSEENEEEQHQLISEAPICDEYTYIFKQNLLTQIKNHYLDEITKFQYDVKNRLIYEGYRVDRYTKYEYVNDSLVGYETNWRDEEEFFNIVYKDTIEETFNRIDDSLIVKKIFDMNKNLVEALYYESSEDYFSITYEYNELQQRIKEVRVLCHNNGEKWMYLVQEVLKIKYDTFGNKIKETSHKGEKSYEYDQTGNWIKKTINSDRRG